MTHVNVSTLHIFIIAGSEIGAYTHHGFIPWDDDFDVMVNVSQRDILKLELQSVPDTLLGNSGIIISHVHPCISRYGLSLKLYSLT